MGTPEDILIYFSDIWGTKPRPEKQDMLMDWTDYWQNYFHAYAGDMNSVLDMLIPESGYDLDLHDPVILSIEHQLTIAVDPTDGGTTSPSVGSYWYGEGSSVTVTETPNPGYVFDHWDLDGSNVGSGTSYTVTMNAPHTLTAIFMHACK